MARVSKTKQSKVKLPKKLSISLGKKAGLKYLPEPSYCPSDWYKRMADHMENGVWVADNKLNLIYVNSATCKLTGYTHEEIIGKNEFDIWDKKTVETVKKIVATDRKQGMASSYEGTIITKSGEKIPILSHGTPLPDGGTIVTVTDLREVKKKEEDLRKSEKRFKNLANSLPQAVFESDLKGNILFVNEEAYKMFRYIKKDFEKGVNAFNVICPKERARAIKFARKTLYTKKTASMEITAVRKDGTKFPATIHASPIVREGYVIGVRGILIDMTKIKEAEEKIIISEQKYKDLFRKYRELFNNMSSGVAVYKAVNNGKDFVFINFNKAAERIEKIKREEVIDKKVTKIFPGIKKFGLFEVFQRVWKTGKPEFFPTTFYEDDRITSWRENYVYKLPNGQIVAVYDDVTERKQAEEFMLKLRQATEQSMDGVAMANMDGVLEFANTAWAKMHGYKLNEIIGKNLSIFHTKEQVKNDVLPFNEQVIKKGGYQGEVGHVKKDGITFPTYMTTTLLKNKEGKPVGLVGLARDITKQKEAERILEQRIREFNVLYRIHSHIKLEHRLSKVMSYIASDLVYGFQFIDVAQAQIVFDDKKYQSSNEKMEFVYKLEKPLIVAGVKRGFIRVGYTKKLPQMQKMPFSQEEQKLAKGVAHTLSKHIYNREIINRHKKIVRRSFTAIYITVDGILRYLNPRFCKMFQVNEEEAIGQPISKFIISRPEFKDDVNLSGTYHCETEGIQKDGNIINLDMVTQNIDYHGEKAVLGRAHDITVLKKAEARLKNFNEELKELVNEKTQHLELANKRLQSLNELKDEFIAVTSHELRSPLTSIRGYLSFLAERESLESVPDSLQQYILRAYNNAESLNYLVNNILDVSRLDLGRFELQLVSVDIIHLIKNIIDSLSFQANEKNLNIDFKNLTSVNELILKIDTIRISQVLRNLLDNAIKYSRRNKDITIKIYTQNGFVFIEIMDQGVGIPKNQVNKIFDKFIQLKNVQSRYKGGAGLGLFIAKRIIELHGGIIKAESEKNKGTTFIIQLPLIFENA